MRDADPSVPFEVLLRERPWVRALARSLVLDENDADDLEQTTWLAALERPPREDRSPRGWLATVLRRAAGKARRSDARLDHREREAARPEAVPGTTDIVSTAEQHRRLVGMVLELAEPYRGAVLARYFDGRPPREIAATSGVPLKTVASHLSRGLDMLRARLDRESRGDRRAWCATLAPLAGRPAPMDAAPRFAPRGSPSGGPTAGRGSSILEGVLLMGTKGKAAIVVVALFAAVGSWWLFQRGGGGAPTDAPVTLAERPSASGPSLAAAPRGDRERPVAATEAVGARGGGAPDEAAADGWDVAIVERVDGVAKGVPAARFSGAAEGGGGFHGTVLPDGTGFVPAPPLARTSVWASAEGFALRRVVFPSGPKGENPEIVLERAGVVEIRFVRAGGVSLEALPTESIRARYESVPAAKVVRVVSAEDAANSRDIRESIRRMTTASEGWEYDAELTFGPDGARLSVGLPGSGALLLVARPGDEPVYVRAMKGADGRLVAIVPWQESAPVALVRAVDGGTGNPVPKASFVPYVDSGQGTLFLPGYPILADADGNAEIPLSGVGDQGTDAVTWWVFGRDGVGRLDLPSGTRATDARITVRLQPVAKIRGRAYLRSGEPAVGRFVCAGRKGLFQAFPVKADGSFEVRGAVPEPNGSDPVPVVNVFLIEDVDAMAMAFEKVHVRPGETAEVQFGRPASASGARLKGRITAGGSPIAGVEIAVAFGPGKGGTVTTTAADGTYAMDRVPSGEVHLHAALFGLAASDGAYVESSAPLRLVDGAEQIADFDLPAGVIRVRVVEGASGKPASGVRVTATPEDRGAESDRFPGYRFHAGALATTDANGVALLRGLPLGFSHRVECGAKGTTRVAEAKGVRPAAGSAPTELVLRLDGS